MVLFPAPGPGTQLIIHVAPIHGLLTTWHLGGEMPPDQRITILQPGLTAGKLRITGPTFEIVRMNSCLRDMFGVGNQTTAIAISTDRNTYRVNLLTTDQSSITALLTVQYHTTTARTANTKTATAGIPINQAHGHIVTDRMHTGIDGMVVDSPQTFIGTEATLDHGPILPAEIITIAGMTPYGNTAVCAFHPQMLNSLRDRQKRQQVQMQRIQNPQRASPEGLVGRNCLSQALGRIMEVSKRTRNPRTSQNPLHQTVRHQTQGTMEGCIHGGATANPLTFRQIWNLRGVRVDIKSRGPSHGAAIAFRLIRRSCQQGQREIYHCRRNGSHCRLNRSPPASRERSKRRRGSLLL